MTTERTSVRVGRAVVIWACGCCWVGTLITGVLGMMAADEEADAQNLENVHEREWAEKLNKIQLDLDRRDFQFKQDQFRWEQQKDTRQQFEGLINQSVGLKDRLAKIWPTAA